MLNEQFIDWRTRAVLKRTAEGHVVPVVEREEVRTPISPVAVDPEGGIQLPDAGGLPVASVEDQTSSGEEQLAALQVQLVPRADAAPLRIPQLRMTLIKNEFSLADVTDRETFRRLGESIAADPVGALRRVTLSARIIEGPDGLRRTELVTAQAIDRVQSPASLFPIEELKEGLVQRVLAAPAVPARANQRRPAENIVDSFIKGLGTQAESILSGYMDRAAAGLIQAITEEQRKFAGKPAYGEVVEISEFKKVRNGRPESSSDRFGAFKKGVGYEGYAKSLYAQDWFDSSTERAVANVLEDEPSIMQWVRLQTGDLPILWNGAGREYNPDFIAIDKHGTHWLIEVKMDKDVSTPDVQGKREAARRWANHVSADDKVNTQWRYLLVSETDVKTAKESWPALKALGGE